MYTILDQKKPQKGSISTMSLSFFDAKIDSFSSVCSEFVEKFRLLATLRSAGAKKLRGTPIRRIIGFLISSIFANGSSFNQQKFSVEGDGIPSYRATNRFLSSECIDWCRVTAETAAEVITTELDPISSKAKEDGVKTYRCLVADDTPFKRDRSSEVDKAVKCYDHASHSYFNGFRDLHLVYTDGISTIPVSHCLMSEKIEGSEERCHMQMNDALFDMIADCQIAGVRADYLLFDSWFGSPKDIKRGNAMGYDVICMVKKAKTKYLTETGRRMTVKSIFSSSKKRRGRSRYLLSTEVTLPDSTQKAKLVFVRNRSNRKDWLVLLSTDLELSEDEVVAAYSQRWNIETFFKNYKQDLRAVSRCRARKYSVVNANCAIAMIQYMVMAVEKRIQSDSRTLGELFVSILDDGVIETLSRAVDELGSLFASEVSKRFGVDEMELRTQINEILELYISAFKVSIERAA